MESSDSGTAGVSSTLPLGFATAVTMWAVAYVGHLPVIMAPGWLVLGAMVAAALGWGAFVGRTEAAGWWAGLKVGATAAVLNLLILGSLLGGDGGAVRPAAAIWVPGSILALAVLVAAAARLATAEHRSPRPHPTAVFAWTAVAATFLLVVAGGLVTSNEAGLAVVDWPNTFGSNMFLYPLARMTGGIYYEHAHRLFGALVGLTTLCLAFHLWRTRAHQRLVRLGALASVLVVIQGLLGGLRVTGRLTLSTAAEAMAPSITLAVVHGVLGQLFLALLVGMAVASLPSWQRCGAAEEAGDAVTDHRLQLALVAVLIVQLVFGAVQRHVAFGLSIHVAFAAVVAMVAAVTGARSWWLRPGHPVLVRLGQALLVVVGLQVTLGVVALAVTAGEAVVGTPSVLEVTVATAHQACGAALLAVVVALTVWTRRLLAVAPS